MLVGIADRRRRYDADRRHQPFYSLVQLSDEGLTLGRGCRLARGDPASGEACFADDAERLMVLLSAVYNRPVSPVVVKQARRAAGHWRRGNKALAHIELAFVPSPNDGAAEDGTVPDRPGLRYRLDRDAGMLRLADAADPDPRHALVAQFGPDGVYRDVGTRVAVARALGGSVVLIDLDRAPATSDQATEGDDGPKLCPTPKEDRPGGRRLFDVLYERYVRDAVNPQRRPQLPPGLTFALPGDVPSGWVHYDDCREADGAMVEAKGNYADFLASSFGERKLTDEWLDQAGKQVRAAGNRRVEWYFHDPEAAAFAKGLFAKKYGMIGIHVLPYPGGIPKPNPRVR